MIRRPPRSTRTDTLFPYTTLFRSGRNFAKPRSVGDRYAMRGGEHVHARVLGPNLSETIDIAEIDRCNAADKPDEREALDRRLAVKFDLDPVGAGTRSEESPVGNEGGRACRSRWSPYH